MLALGDFKGWSEDKVKEHLVKDYEALPEQLKDLEVLIAYESVGSWGCDSSSFFLFKNRETGVLFENHGSHCSCYGFEGQFTPEETGVEALKFRVNQSSHGSVFYAGGYDNDEDGNYKAVNECILAMQ